MPNDITYNALITSCAKGTQPAQALEVFEAMQQQRVVPNDITYNALITTCANRPQPAQAL